MSSLSLSAATLRAPASNTTLNPGRPREAAPSIYGFVGKAIASALATGLVALLVQLAAGRESWLHNFFFMRGPIQWLIVGLGLYGIIELLSLIPQSRRARRGLQVWQHGGEPAADAGLVWSRFIRLQGLLESSAVTDVRAAAREMAQEAEVALAARYSAVAMVTYVAPFLGLVGTLGGMSQGLSRSFGRAGTLDLVPFRAALSSSLENSYAAIFTTILLIVLAHMLRSRDESVLAQTDSQVMEVLFEHERQASATLGLENGPAMANPALFFSQAVAVIAGPVREISAAVLELAQQVRATMEATNGTLAELRSTRTAVEAAHGDLTGVGVKISQSLAATTNTLASAVAESSASMTRALAQQSQKLDDAVLRLADCAGVLSGVKQAVERPREFSVRIAEQ